MRRLQGEIIRFFRVPGIQRRLGIIFLAFLCLLVISVALTFSGLDAQKQDARVINLAGRQRMLIQRMSSLALSAEFDEENENIPALVTAANTFEETLTVLHGGGAILDYTGEQVVLLPPFDPALKVELDKLQTDWQTYRPWIDQIAHASDTGIKHSAAQQIVLQSTGLVAQADRVVRAFEAVSVARVTRLRTYQIGFLLAGFVLLSAGWWVTSVSISRPLSRLAQAARQIGDGDLSAPVAARGTSEVKTLSRTMETMRAQILSSRLDLQQWAETLENRVRQRTRELEALSAVSREINSHLSIEEVLTSVTEKARVLLGGEVASLCLLDDTGKVLSLHAAAAPDTAIRTNHSPADRADVGMILRPQPGQHCAHPCGLHAQQGFCQILAPAFRISHLAAPLYAKEKVIGALCVGSSSPEAFRPEMAPILAQLSDAAAVALENSRLYQQSEYIATLEERQRIAAEMHDGLLQTLNFLRLMVGLLDEQLQGGEVEKAFATMRHIQRAEEQSEREIRRAIDSLQDDYPLNDTLQDRLSALIKDVSFTQSPVTFTSYIIRPLLLSRQESEQVLRVAREAILNAQRYSHAEKITVSLETQDQDIIVTVQDQGVGFIPGTILEDGRAHFGLRIMQARAARLGGRLSIQSNPGEGTLVQLSWKPGYKTGAGE